MSKKRLMFSKGGRAVYISHLDLMRTLQRSFRRAELDMKHSEGFNPHPVMSLILPLSLGQSSRCEFMDFELLTEIDDSLIPERLNKVLPEGVEAIEVWEAEKKSKELKWLRVRGELEYDGREDGELVEALRAFYSRDELVITRKTKRGMGESDIVPAIKSVEVSAEGEKVVLDAVISAQEPTLNPEHLVSALKQLAPELAPDFASFERIEALDTEMKKFR